MQNELLMGLVDKVSGDHEFRRWAWEDLEVALRFYGFGHARGAGGGRGSHARIIGMSEENLAGYRRFLSIRTGTY